MVKFDEAPPGSDKAIELGCTCPVIDNSRGKGAYELEGVPQYWISAECPIHGGRKGES